MAKLTCKYLGKASGTMKCHGCPRRSRDEPVFTCNFHKKLCSPGCMVTGNAIWCDACLDFDTDREIPNTVTSTQTRHANYGHTGHIGSPDTLCPLCSRPALNNPRVRANLGLPPLPYDLVPGVNEPIPASVDPNRASGWSHDPKVRDRHIWALRKLSVTTMPRPNRADGDGIIYVGGGRYWPMIVTGVRMARRYTKLPIQIWYRGDIEPVNATDLTGVNDISFHDSSKFPNRILGGWEAKSVAMINCGLRRFLFLDADAYLVNDPRSFFAMATPLTPFVYWQDLSGHDTAVDWPWYGIPHGRGQSVPCVQGGQIVVDRLVAWKELVLYHWLNQHSDYTYSHGYGDQDQLRVAWAVTGGKFHCLGRATWIHPAFVCRAGNHDLIVHRCRGKMWGNQDDVKTNHLPGDANAWSYLNRSYPNTTDAATVFGRVYLTGAWGHGDKSGGGSTPAEAKPYLDYVNRLITSSGWQRVVDLGCGDGYVTARLAAKSVAGVDVYGKHIEALKDRYPSKEWYNLDLDRDRDRLPSGDIALLKDVLHHWPNSLITDWLTWAKTSKKWKAVILTNVHRQTDEMIDCSLGGYRGLDHRREPLRSITGLRRVYSYLHKSVLVLDTGE